MIKREGKLIPAMVYTDLDYSMPTSKKIPHAPGWTDDAIKGLKETAENQNTATLQWMREQGVPPEAMAQQVAQQVATQIGKTGGEVQTPQTVVITDPLQQSTPQVLTTGKFKLEEKEFEKLDKQLKALEKLGIEEGIEPKMRDLEKIKEKTKE